MNQYLMIRKIWVIAALIWNRGHFLWLLITMVSQAIYKLLATVMRAVRILGCHRWFSLMMFQSLMLGWRLPLSGNRHLNFTVCWLNCWRCTPWKVGTISLISKVNWLVCLSSCSQERNSAVNSESLVVSLLLLCCRRRSCDSMMGLSFLTSHLARISKVSAWSRARCHFFTSSLIFQSNSY